MPKPVCQCGYPATPCDRVKNDWGHDCIFLNEEYAKDIARVTRPKRERYEYEGKPDGIRDVLPTPR